MENFDYIIIGAGSAGCVLANTLSANPNNKILLMFSNSLFSLQLIKIRLNKNNLRKVVI